MSRTGHIRPGGWLDIEYDPARLAPNLEKPGPTSEIVCHVRFTPGGQTRTGAVGAFSSREGTARPLPFEVAVPADATAVELWFEGRGPVGTSGWDSRHGQNYSFVVIGEGLPVPEPSVAMRAEVLVDPSAIQVVEDAAMKEQTSIGPSGKRVHTGLVVRARVSDPSGAIDVWADIHVFDAADQLIQASSVSLQRRERTDDGALFVWEDDVYQGSGGGSGMGVWSRPDAHTIQYRLYYQTQPARSIVTDGVLHEFEVPADEDVDRAARGQSF